MDELLDVLIESGGTISFIHFYFIDVHKHAYVVLDPYCGPSLVACFTFKDADYPREDRYSSCVNKIVPCALVSRLPRSAGAQVPQTL